MDRDELDYTKEYYSKKIPDPFSYSLSITEASEFMLKCRCKFPSPRKIQRLCRNGNIDCFKLKTSRNGQPVTEWLVNEMSLRKRIEEHEPLLEDGGVIATATSSGVATKNNNEVTATNDLAMPDTNGDADSTSLQNHEAEYLGNVVATPEAIGDADHTEPSKAELMIENAKLSAELEGTKLLIVEILDDKTFLREELRDAREGRKDVTKIAERMLEAMETMAVGAKIERLPENKVQAQSAQQFDRPTGDNDDDYTNQFGV